MSAVFGVGIWKKRTGRRVSSARKYTTQRAVSEAPRPPSFGSFIVGGCGSDFDPDSQFMCTAVFGANFNTKGRFCDQDHILSCRTQRSILAERDLYGSPHRIDLDCSIDIDCALRSLWSSNRPQVAQANLSSLPLSTLLPKSRIGVFGAHQETVLELWANGSRCFANARCEVVRSPSWAKSISWSCLRRG